MTFPAQNPQRALRGADGLLRQIKNCVILQDTAGQPGNSRPHAGAYLVGRAGLGYGGSSTSVNRLNGLGEVLDASGEAAVFLESWVGTPSTCQTLTATRQNCKKETLTR